MVEVPTIKFNNGQTFPLFGLGTWKSKPDEVYQAVKDAIDIGYRHFDCAHLYENEKEVGQAIAAKISEGVVKREDLYITSKLWNHSHRPAAVEPALKLTLKNLGLSYIDLYLIHWPLAFKEGEELWPRDANGKLIFIDVDYVDTWKAMEEIYKKGLAKSIGISNFNKEQIERILKVAEVIPVSNQVESSPFLNQQKLLDYCTSKGITLTAYSPLGAPERSSAKPSDPKLLDSDKFKSLAQKYKKTPAQIVLKYQVQRNIITIPKSVNKARIGENFNIFDFEISEEDMKYLNNLDHNGRTCWCNEGKEDKYYPFHAEY